jgi:ribose transport system substrate-binding protein
MRYSAACFTELMVSAPALARPMIWAFELCARIALFRDADGQATGRDVMLEIIASYPELRGVFASNPMVAKGAPDAGRAHTNKPAIRSISSSSIRTTNSSNSWRTARSQPSLCRTRFMQDPFRTGYDGVKIALAASKGDQVPANVDTGATVITKANMNSARSQELLNPQVIGIGGQP